MSSFTNATFQPTGQRRNGRALYRIVGEHNQGLRFDIGYEGSGLSVVVPEGFITDGPSVPVWIRWALPVKTMVKAAAVHDRLREDLRFNKLEGDAIFLTAMRAEKTPAWLRELAFIAVRLNRSRARSV